MAELFDEVEYIELIPPYLAENKEFVALDKTLKASLTDCWMKIEGVFDAQYLETLDSSGCEHWENIMGLAHTGSLADRRTRILVKYNEVLPYDVNALRRILKSRIGNDLFEIEVVPNEFLLIISLDKTNKNMLGIVESVCKYVVPANMIVQSVLRLNTYAYLKDRYNYGEMSQHTYDELTYI